MLVLATDYGTVDPYVGQLKLAIARYAPTLAAIDLCHHLPPLQPRLAAHLLAAWGHDLPGGAVVCAVVDPGVGDPQRRAVALRTARHWWVGPDNGLFDVIAARATAAQWHEIAWSPERLSASFHGRDLFAPVAAQLAVGVAPERLLRVCQAPAMPTSGGDLAEIIYIDHFGNAMTGLRAPGFSDTVIFSVAGVQLGYARTFSDAPPHVPFWYENANGLIEFAMNQESAAARLGLRLGMSVMPKGAA